MAPRVPRKTFTSPARLATLIVCRPGVTKPFAQLRFRYVRYRSGFASYTWRRYRAALLTLTARTSATSLIRSDRIDAVCVVEFVDFFLPSSPACPRKNFASNQALWRQPYWSSRLL